MRRSRNCRRKTSWKLTDRNKIHTMDTLGLQMIGTQRVGGGAQTFRAWAPSKQDWLPHLFREATAAETDAAVSLAAKAFDAYKQTAAKDRAAFLRAIAAGLEALGETLLHTASEESGLPLARLQGERDRTTNQLRLFAKVIEEGSWVNARIDRGTPDVRQMQIPWGPWRYSARAISRWPFPWRATPRRPWPPDAPWSAKPTPHTRIPLTWQRKRFWARRRKPACRRAFSASFMALLSKRAIPCPAPATARYCVYRVVRRG